MRENSDAPISGGFVCEIWSIKSILVEKVRMDADEVFEVFVMPGRYTRTNLCREKFKLREG